MQSPCLGKNHKPPLLRDISLRRDVPKRTLLRELLLSWHKVLTRYCEAFKWNDCPWWYSERPGVSTLSGAVWAMDGIALEEFKVKKRAEDKRGAYGRCDLYFGLPSGKSHSHFDVECKHCWVKLHEPFEVGVDRITEALKNASRDAEKLPKNASTRLGIVFVSFCAGKSHYDQDTELRKWAKELKSKKLNHAAAAWFLLTNRHSECPGAALLVARPDIHK
jgi:hypothetical protein